MPAGDDVYGIVANVREADGALRLGAKCWLIGGQSGDGGERFEWRGLSRGGRRITKYAPTKRFEKFRAAWIPDEIRGEFYAALYGSRDEVEMWAKMFNERHPPGPT